VIAVLCEQEAPDLRTLTSLAIQSGYDVPLIDGSSVNGSADGGANVLPGRARLTAGDRADIASAAAALDAAAADVAAAAAELAGLGGDISAAAAEIVAAAAAIAEGATAVAAAASVAERPGAADEDAAEAADALADQLVDQLDAAAQQDPGNESAGVDAAGVINAICN